MSANLQRSPDATQTFAASDDLSASPPASASSNNIPASFGDEGDAAHASCATQHTENVLTLSALPVGARLVLRCRKDWRDATIAAVAPDQITLSVGSPSGRTYRVRRPPDSPLSLDGAIPVLGDGDAWRIALARYDTRW